MNKLFGIVFLMLSMVAHAEVTGPTAQYLEREKSDVVWAKDFVKRFSSQLIGKTCPGKATPTAQYPCFVEEFETALRTRQPTESGLAVMMLAGASILMKNGTSKSSNESVDDAHIPTLDALRTIELLARGIDYLNANKKKLPDAHGYQYGQLQTLPKEPNAREEALLRDLRYRINRKFILSFYTRGETLLKVIKNRSGVNVENPPIYKDRYFKLVSRFDVFKNRIPPEVPELPKSDPK